MTDGPLHPEQVRVNVLLTGPVTKLAGQTDVQLVFGDCFQNRAVRIRARSIWIKSDINGLDRRGHSVDFLPGHLEIGPPGTNYPNLRIHISLTVLRTQILGDRQVERCSVSQALSATKIRDHRALVLVHRVNAAEEKTVD